jgi:hypothetical protein
MSHITVLWHSVTDHLKKNLGPSAEGGSGKAKTVAPYPATITADEVVHESFNAPAILVQLVDWKENEDEQGCYVDADFLFMCVTKHYKSRNARAFEAAALSECVWCALKGFEPADAVEGAVLQDIKTSINGYSRALDNKNQALRMVAATYTLPLACGNGENTAAVVDLSQWDIFDADLNSYQPADYPDTNTDGFADLPGPPSTPNPAADDPVIRQHNSSESTS